MVDAADLYSLVSAVLNRDDETRKVLADLLEESGQRGLAKWARKGKGPKRKRLDFVLAIVPYTNAVLLACDFVDHLGAELFKGRGRRIVEIVRNAVRGEQLSTPWLSEARETAKRLARGNPQMRGVVSLFEQDCLISLIDAGQHALLAAWHRQQGHSRDSAAFGQKAQALARRTTKATHYFDANQINWQIEHTTEEMRKIWPK
jgi:hypothetical protein